MTQDCGKRLAASKEVAYISAAAHSSHSGRLLVTGTSNFRQDEVVVRSKQRVAITSSISTFLFTFIFVKQLKRHFASRTLDASSFVCAQSCWPSSCLVYGCCISVSTSLAAVGNTLDEKPPKRRDAQIDRAPWYLIRSDSPYFMINMTWSSWLRLPAVRMYCPFVGTIHETRCDVADLVFSCVFSGTVHFYLNRWVDLSHWCKEEVMTRMQLSCIYQSSQCSERQPMNHSFSCMQERRTGPDSKCPQHRWERHFWQNRKLVLFLIR